MRNPPYFFLECKMLQLKFALLNKKTVSLELNESDNISTIKEKIEKLDIIPLANLEILYQGVYLQDNHCLGDYDIPNDANIDVKFTCGHRITLIIGTEANSEQTFTTKVSLLDTVESVKRQIEEIWGIGTELQKLSYNGVLLDDDKVFGYYGMADNSNLLLSFNCEHDLDLEIQMPSDEKEIFTMSCFKKIADLKEIIWRKTGIPIYLQCLRFGDILLADNDKTLCFYNIMKRSSLSLDITDADIEVSIQMLSGKPYKINCNIHKTIGLLKQEIHKLKFIPVEHQRLVFEDVELEDHKTLWEYRITRENCSLNLLVQNEISINVKTSNELLKFKVLPTEKIQKILDLIPDTDSSSLDRAVTYNCIILDVNQNFAYYEIGSGAEILVTYKNPVCLQDDTNSINLSVDVAFNKRIVIQREKNSTIQNLKDEIFGHTEISPNLQHLYYNERELKNEETLTKCNLKDYSCLQVKVPIKFITESNKSLQILMSMSLTVGQMLQEIVDYDTGVKNSLVPESWCLIYKEEVLERDKDLNFYKFQYATDELRLYRDKRNEKYIKIRDVIVGNSLLLPVELKYDTIRSVKEMVNNLNYPSDQKSLRLFVNEEECKDDEKSLFECGITEESELIILESNITLSIVSTTGKHHQLDVKYWQKNIDQNIAYFMKL